MRMSEGVEWGLHSCVLLGWLSPEPAPAGKLAAYYDLPPAYLNKQLQALARAGIVESIPGPRGGFRLARRPDRITVMDVVAAIEGPEDAFRCQEIRQQAPVALPPEHYRAPCSIAATMRRAELAWRRELAASSIADIIAGVENHGNSPAERARRWFDHGRGAAQIDSTEHAAKGNPG